MSIECQEFYELMQAYRHCPIVPPGGPAEAYQAVIKFANEYADRRVESALARERGEDHDEEEEEEGDDRPRSFPEASFLKNVIPSDILAAVVGPEPLPRTEITKKVWEYIKANNLQDAANRRMINADEKLKEIFGGKTQVSMFEMTKLISDHIKPA